MSDHGIAEQCAFDFYERVGCDPAEPVDPFTLTRKFLGAGTIVRGANLVGSPAATFVLDGQRKIAVRRNLPIEYAAFYVAHELGHIVLEEAGYRDDDLEQQCDLFGAALLAPRPAIVRLHRELGFDLGAIASEVGSTETWAALRLGEVLRLPLVAIAPMRVRVRGPVEWVWPDESTLRSWVKRTPRGIVKTKLSDDPRRHVFVADDCAAVL